eukprot:TRINITY_DN312_c2_g1_i1.p1 TRINITY_DN312_c2_g1~~TRINITY_DN312_c2_g1_i1.p1  ORF type:complete len:217 (+),score=45.72 TRINITY_DN312_c2_g1_i1:89-739(+)
MIGFEHIPANFYITLSGLLANCSKVTFADVLLKNWVPVTLGNFFAGAFIVAGGYSFVYGRLGELLLPTKGTEIVQLAVPEAEEAAEEVSLDLEQQAEAEPSPQSLCSKAEGAAVGGFPDFPLPSLLTSASPSKRPFETKLKGSLPPLDHSLEKLPAAAKLSRAASTSKRKSSTGQPSLPSDAQIERGHAKRRARDMDFEVDTFFRRCVSENSLHGM